MTEDTVGDTYELSYDEIAMIEDKWLEFKQANGCADEWSDGCLAWEFIEKECKDTYDTEAEQLAIFDAIGAYERRAKEIRERKRND